MYKRLFTALLLLGGCHSYKVETPDNFVAEPVQVTGKQSSLRIGEHQLSGFKRSWTKGSGMELLSVKSQKRKQTYQFRVASTESTDTTEVQCEFAANERTVGMKGGWELMAGEGASLTCTVASADSSARLALESESDAVLSGTFKGAHGYHVQGIGTTSLFKDKGTAGGFHVLDGDRVVAVAQVLGSRRVMFARGTDAKVRAQLVPVLAALLLLDESIREF